MADNVAILEDFVRSQFTDGKGATGRKLLERIDTVAYKIRLPRPDDRSCNSTPMRDRWVTQDSYLKPQDPRYATEEQCKAIKATLLAHACEFQGMPDPPPNVRAAAEAVLGRQFSPGSATCFQNGDQLSRDDLALAATISTNQVGSAELTVEYRTALENGGLHRSDNLDWVRPPREILALRTILKDNGVPGTLLSKVQLKAYSTDKVTMPPHFSNRDYRWATWVDSNQFASRTDCRGVELQLLAQILEFDGAPKLSEQHTKEVEEHLNRELKPGSCLCPITGEKLVYADFMEAVNNPQAGKSAYHVGHLDPLTRDGKHQKDNVVWMSDAGNRIQGNDTFDEIVGLIKRAAEYHIREGR